VAVLIPFAFRPGSSGIHRLDVRYKLMMICLLSICLVRSGGWACLLYFLTLNLCFYVSTINPYRILMQMKLFIVLLAFVFVARSVTTPGDEWASLFGITATRQGVLDGMLVAARFGLVMLTGLLFCTTTRPSEVKGAVQWFLAPIPFIPEKRVGVMVSLTLAFMPVILKQARSIQDAQAARCGNLEKNPIKRITRLALPLLKNTFLRADRMALAMASRCYSDDRSDPEFSPSGQERLYLLGCGTIAAALVFL
jgi:biotin transport system permease protein